MKPLRSDMNLKMSEEKSLKEKVLQSAEAVKKKVKLIRDIKNSDNMMLESVLKPITDPLNEIVKSNKNNDFFHGNETDLDNEDHEWVNANKILKFTPTGYKKQSITNKTIVKKSSESDSNTEDEISLTNSEGQEDSLSCESAKNVLNTSNDTSFKTSDSYASPRDDPAWQKDHNSHFSIPFGVRMERNKFMLGSCPISVSEKNLKLNGRTYDLTPGLYAMLFKKLPDLNIITEDDKRQYKMLLLETNAHRRDFSPNKPIKSNKGKKYLYIIKPLFKLSKPRLASEESHTYGSGLPTMKKIKKDVSYVYWDDPNELVERLKLLIAARDAGNTGLDNEIISIIEELREAGLVSNGI